MVYWKSGDFIYNKNRNLHSLLIRHFRVVAKSSRSLKFSYRSINRWLSGACHSPPERRPPLRDWHLDRPWLFANLSDAVDKDLYAKLGLCVLLVAGLRLPKTNIQISIFLSQWLQICLRSTSWSSWWMRLCLWWHDFHIHRFHRWSWAVPQKDRRCRSSRKSEGRYEIHHSTAEDGIPWIVLHVCLGFDMCRGETFSILFLAIKHENNCTRGGGCLSLRKMSIYQGKFRATRLNAAASGDEA